MKPRDLGQRTSGPYRVLQTHVNGTLIVELRPGISERLNIRRVIPYKEPTVTKLEMCKLQAKIDFIRGKVRPYYRCINN